MNKSLVAMVGTVLIFSAVWEYDTRAENASGAAGSKLIEPVSLLSSEEARELTGIELGECRLKERPVVGLKLCIYEKDGALAQLGLTQDAFMDKRSTQTPETIYRSIKGAFPDAAKVQGLGDDSFIAPPGIHILADGYYITISLGLANTDPQTLKALGLKAVENLHRISEER